MATMFQFFKLKVRRWYFAKYQRRSLKFQNWNFVAIPGHHKKPSKNMKPRWIWVHAIKVLLVSPLFSYQRKPWQPLGIDPRKLCWFMFMQFETLSKCCTKNKNVCISIIILQLVHTCTYFLENWLLSGVCFCASVTIWKMKFVKSDENMRDGWSFFLGIASAGITGIATVIIIVGANVKSWI